MSHYKSYPAYKDSGVEWLGWVPKHWLPTSLSYLAEYVNGYPFAPEQWSQKGLPIIRIAQLTGKPFDNYFDGNLSGGVKVRDGDLLFSWSATIDCFIWAQGDAWLNQHIFRVIPSPAVEPQYLYHLIRHVAPKLADFDAHGSTMRHIKKESLKEKLFIPPASEQMRISAHLDRETAHIDELIDKKSQFIERLREKREALIIHAVTKGLTPNAKMKDSGVEWVGEVPEHWCVKQLKHVVDPNSSITYGIVQAGPQYEGGVPYIRTSDMSGDELPVNGYPLTSPEIDESYARSRVRPGDIVMSIRASVGKCLLVPDELSIANLTQGTAKVSPGQKITREFLLAFLNSGAAQAYFDLMAKGATFKEITLDALRRTPVLLPPRDEQIEIDRFIALHVGRLDRLIRLSERSVVMLKERRSALITAAVTGQIDLREAV